VVGDSAGNVYFADGNHLVRMINKTTSILSNIAGNTACTPSWAPGPALSISICRPRSLAINDNQELFVADELFTLRRINLRTSMMYLIAGNVSGFVDNVTPINARFVTLDSMWINLQSNSNGVYGTDYSNHRVRYIDFDNNYVSTFVGNGAASYQEGAVASSATAFSYPSGVCGSNNQIFLTTLYLYRIVRVQLSNSILKTLVGGGIGLGEEFVSTSQIGYAYSCFAVSNSIMYFSESYGTRNRVRRVQYTEPTSQPTSQPSTRPS